MSDAIDNGQDKKTGEFHLYDNFKWPSGVPKKPFNELTPEEQKRVRDTYRFCGFSPGIYQGLSGLGNIT